MSFECKLYNFYRTFGISFKHARIHASSAYMSCSVKYSVPCNVCYSIPTFVDTRSNLCSHTYQPAQKASEEAVNTHLIVIRDQLYFAILNLAKPPTASASATITASTAVVTESSGSNTKNTASGSKSNATAATTSVVMGILRVHLSFCSLLRRCKHGTDPARARVLKESASQGLTLCKAYLESHADAVRSV